MRGFLATVLLAGLVYSTVLAEEPLSGTQEVSAVFSLASEKAGSERIFDIAAYNTAANEVVIYVRKGAVLTDRLHLSVEENVWGVERVPEGYVVVTGEGRGSTGAPLRVWFFPLSGNNKTPRKVFEHLSERNQATQLRWESGKLWLTFFDSKYTTKTGCFDPSRGGEWSFHEVFSTRLGTSVDIAQGRIAVGRPYGDAQGHDGDAILIEDGMQTLLPSYRGVRSLRFFGDSKNPKIVMGDGWHQNYGQIAQARLSLLQRDPVSRRYSLQLIRRDLAQYEYSKLFPFSLGGREYVAALGNKNFDVVPFETGKEPVLLYSRLAEDKPFDAAYLGSDGARAWFVVVDRGLHIREFPFRPQ